MTFKTDRKKEKQADNYLEKDKGRGFAVILMLPVILFLCVLVPLYTIVVTAGNRIEYNPLHKITLGTDNFILFIPAVALGFVLCYAIKVFSGFRLKTDPRVLTGLTIFTAGIVSVGLYFMNVYMARKMGFFGGWDCGMVANSVRDIYRGGDMGYGNYYQIFPNNIPIMYVMYRLYEKAMSLNPVEAPEFIWVRFQCVLVSLSVFICALTAHVIAKKNSVTLITLFLSAIVLGLSPWEVIPYTDVSSIIFPIMILFFYALYLKTDGFMKYIFLIIGIFLGFLGGIMKATVYVSLIALILIEIIRFILDIKNRCKAIIFLILGILAACILSGIYKEHMYNVLDYKEDPHYQAEWCNYFYMGLNEERTGASNPDGYNLINEYFSLEPSDRKTLELKLGFERLKEKGFVGGLSFYVKKMVMTFNDGTFSWFKEGSFNIGFFSESNGDENPPKHSYFLRSFYCEDGERFVLFNTISQFFWLFILLGIILFGLGTLFGYMRYKKSDESLILRTFIFTVMLGMFMFLMMFEGRARYLLNYLPLFLTVSVLGINDMAKLFSKNEDIF